MLSIDFIRNNAEAVKSGVAKKRIDAKLVDKFLRYDSEWRSKIAALEQLKAEQNMVSKELGRVQSEDLLSKAEILKKRIVELEDECASLGKKRDDLLEKFPNIPFVDVPVGSDASGNIVLREVGAKPVFSFEPKDYLTLGESLGIIDVRRAANVVGSRFGYLLGDAARLEFALVLHALKVTEKYGFTPVVPPVMVRPEVFSGMGRLAADQRDERYFLSKDNLYLVGSAEHTVGPFHMGETLAADSLPRRYVAFSTCFRREAGSYGKDTKGILRVHQFDKVELFSFAHPDESEKEHEFLLSVQEALMQSLKLPYRIMHICTGDMGWVDARQFDVDTWLPGTKEYRETHSCSNTTDFQSRGIGAKYKSADGKKKEHLHMLNATGYAIGRTIIAILENYQTDTGAVRVPDVLQSYVGKKLIEKNTQ